jgi:hypothetical protein
MPDLFVLEDKAFPTLPVFSTLAIPIQNQDRVLLVTTVLSELHIPFHVQRVNIVLILVRHYALLVMLVLIVKNKVYLQ